MCIRDRQTGARSSGSAVKLRNGECDERPNRPCQAPRGPRNCQRPATLRQYHQQQTLRGKSRVHDKM
eukprot:14285840-Alexandrium_andersonii.AAC.1